jgi:hypothetical protein
MAPRWNMPRRASQTISFSVFRWQTQYISARQRALLRLFISHGGQYTVAMIAEAHFLLYSRGPKADRAFFKTLLEFLLVA